MNIVNVNVGMVLVRPVIDEKSSGGIFLAPTAVGDQIVAGDVVTVGSPELTDGIPNAMTMNPGQRVLFNKSNSYKVKDDTGDVYITYQNQVLAVLA